MKKDRTIRYNVKEVSASRAIFTHAEELPKISLTFTTTIGEKIEFEITIAEAAKLIDQTSHAYSAAIPKLKR